MAIPFKPIERDEPAAPAAYVRLVQNQNDELRAAVFVINSRGEPVEFAYSKADLPESFLWRPRDLERVAIVRLLSDLFEALTSTPALLLCLASEVPAETLQHDLAIAIPTGRVAAGGTRLTLAGKEEPERLDGAEPVELSWYPKRPDEQHPARLLFTKLAERGLIQEPFNRMLAAMDEVFTPGTRAG